MTRIPAYLWAGPATTVGLALALLAFRRGAVRGVGGVLEAHGPWLRQLLSRLPPRPHGIAAITLGHVVLGRDAHALETSRAHERVHVRQYERWGPFFIPLYVVASGWAAVHGRHPYYDNVFEREARG